MTAARPAPARAAPASPSGRVAKRRAEKQRRPGRARALFSIPPQHGAWAFLALPLLLGFALAGPSATGLLFAVTWVAAYPAGYYLDLALSTRLQRGSWGRVALRERARAVPWAITAGAGALLLMVLRPQLAPAGAVLAILWGIGVSLGTVGRRRGIVNDLLLVAQSVAALPLMWVATAGSREIPTQVWVATAVCATYFVGSVIHVKSLIREADDRRWRIADLAFHIGATLWGLLLPWLLVPFAAGLVRSAAMRPGLRPAIIGAVEIVMSTLVLMATVLAVG